MYWFVETYVTSHKVTVVQCVPLATEPGISLIIVPLMRISQRNFKRTTDTHYRPTLQTHHTDTHCRHTLQTRTTDTHYRHTLQTHTTHNRHTLHSTDTHYRHTLQTHSTNTHYRHTIDTHYRHTIQTHTTDTFRFISHTTNVLLFKFPSNIFIGVRIIKEMPGSVASGTHCIINQ